MHHFVLYNENVKSLFNKHDLFQTYNSSCVCIQSAAVDYKQSFNVPNVGFYLLVIFYIHLFFSQSVRYNAYTLSILRR